MSQSGGQLAVFWDYACKPVNLSIADACAALHRVLPPYGAYGGLVTSIRAYLAGFDAIPAQSRDSMLNAFQSAGVGITTYSRQESVNIERLIVVDLFTFLMDHREHSRIQPTFVLVSANPTAYFYAISKLRERGVKVILIGNGTRQLASEGRADVVLDWREICGTMFPGANSNSVGRGFNELSRSSSRQSNTSSRLNTPQATPPRPIGTSKLSPSAPAYEFPASSPKGKSAEVDDDEDESSLPSMPSSVGSQGDWDAHQRGGSEALGGEKVETPFNRTPADSPVQKLSSLHDIFRSAPIPSSEYPSPVQQNALVPSPFGATPVVGLGVNIAFDPVGATADLPIEVPVVDFWGLETTQLEKAISPTIDAVEAMPSRVVGLSPTIETSKIDSPKSAVLSPIVAPARLPPSTGSAVASTSASTFSYATALAKKNANLPGTISASGAYEPPRTTFATNVPPPVSTVAPVAAPAPSSPAKPSRAAFKPLINLLRRRKAAGEVTSLRSAVGGDLVKAWPEIWSALGHDFKSYTKAAEAMGLVKLGGDGGGEWVQLKV